MKKILLVWMLIGASLAFASSGIYRSAYDLVMHETTLNISKSNYARVENPLSMLEEETFSLAASGLTYQYGFSAGVSAGVPLVKNYAAISGSALYFSDLGFYNEMSLFISLAGRIGKVVGLVLENEFTRASMSYGDFYEVFTLENNSWDMTFGANVDFGNDITIGLYFKDIIYSIQEGLVPVINADISYFYQERFVLTGGFATYFTSDNSLSSLFSVSGVVKVSQAIDIFGSLSLLNAFKQMRYGAGVSYSFMRYAVSFGFTMNSEGLFSLGLTLEM